MINQYKAITPGDLKICLAYMNCYDSIVLKNKAINVDIQQEQNSFQELGIVVSRTDNITIAYVITPTKLCWTFAWYFKNVKQ